MLFAILNTYIISNLLIFNLALDFEKNYNFRSFAAVEAAIQSTSNGCVIASAAPVCDHHQSMIQAGTLRIDADGDNCNISDAATAKHDDNDCEDDDDYCNRNDDDNTDDDVDDDDQDLVDDDYDGT